MARHPMDVINDLSRTSGTLKKLEILKAGDSPVLRQILEYAYNPYKVYKMKKLPNEVELHEMGPGDPRILGFDVLDKMAAARGLSDADKRDVLAHIKSIDPRNRVLFTRILKKDLRAGIEAKTINKVFPDLIPEYLCGLAAKYEAKKHKWNKRYWVEKKMDGWRCQAYVSKARQEVYMTTRNGLEIEGYDHIRRELLEIAPEMDFVYDGELMNGRFGSKEEQEASATYILYDGMTQDEWDARKSKGTQQVRRGCLASHLAAYKGLDILHIELVEGKWVSNHDELMDFYLAVLKEGGEGVMLKDPDAFYSFGRSKCWMKHKPYEDVDLEIVGYEEGKKGTKNEGKLGAFIVEFRGVRVNVGGGYSDEQRVSFWRNRDALIGKTMEMRYTPFTVDQPFTPDGSLLFPRFRKLRNDK